jgi:AraC-like DNA-binding protein
MTLRNPLYEVVDLASCQIVINMGKLSATAVTSDRASSRLLILRNKVKSHLSISDIAFQWGFNNVSHFSRTFRAQFGIAPREWRERIASTNRGDATD